ncbi:MAG: MFS transporter [Myxococcota bacterium]
MEAGQIRSLWQEMKALDWVFWVCIYMELMERMAYYGVRLVVPVYMVLPESAGGPGLSHTEKGTILAFWAATQSWLPTFSGGFSDRYGYKRTLAAAVFLKSAGYAVMAMASGFWVFMLGTQLLAAGTGIFKPGLQGTMAHSIARAKSGSVGWGLFYQSVNVGAFFGAYIPAYTRDVYGWSSVFVACSVLVFLNLIPLATYQEPVDERATTADRRSLFELVRESVTTLITSPVLLGFVLISAGFWFAFHQFFDMLPNYVDDWTDSSGLRAALGRTFGWAEWASDGKNIPQEQLLNLNAFLIMTTMFAVAWVSGKMRVLVSTMAGMAIASGALVLLVYSPAVGTLLIAVVAFTLGEMFASPKRQEYMASLAPPGKRALYLGYANMPDGIGWVLGSLVAGGQYEVSGDKVNLARRLLAEEGSVGAVDGWLSSAAAGQPSAEVLKELAERMHTDTPAAAVQALQALPDAERLVAAAEALPRGVVLDVVTSAFPTLPNGVAISDAALREFLFATYHPGSVWWVFIGVGLLSMVLMAGYDRWVRSRVPAGS